MASAVVRFETRVLLLLIYCLMHFPLLVGAMCLSLFWFALFCVLSSFTIILNRKRELVTLFSLFVLRMHCFCKCSVTVPQGVVVWSIVCNCGISLSYSLIF